MAPTALYKHTQFEVSSFITDRVTESRTDRTTDMTTGLHFASFAYINGRMHKNEKVYLF